MATPQLGFICNGLICDVIEDRHICTHDQTEGTHEVTCSIGVYTKTVIKERKLCWLISQEGGTLQPTQQRNYLHATPKKCDLLELLSEVKDKWFLIGEMLDVDAASLRSLQQSNLSDSMRLSRTLQNWINSESSPVTWSTIIAVLYTNFIDEHRVASKIQDKLSNQPLYDKYCHGQSTTAKSLNAFASTREEEMDQRRADTPPTKRGPDQHGDPAQIETKKPKVDLIQLQGPVTDSLSLDATSQ